MDQPSATTPNAAPQPVMSDEELVRLYVRRRDVRCTHCGYALRDQPSARCPECGRTALLADLAWQLRRPVFDLWGGIFAAAITRIIAAAAIIALLMAGMNAASQWLESDRVELWKVMVSFCLIGAVIWTIAACGLRLFRMAYLSRSQRTARSTSSAIERDTAFTRLAARRLAALALPPRGAIFIWFAAITQTLGGAALVWPAIADVYEQIQYVSRMRGFSSQPYVTSAYVQAISSGGMFVCSAAALINLVAMRLILRRKSSLAVPVCLLLCGSLSLTIGITVLIVRHWLDTGW